MSFTMYYPAHRLLRLNLLVLVLAVLTVKRTAAGPTPPSASTETESVRPYKWFEQRRGCMYNAGTRRCLDVEQSRRTWQNADAQMWRCNHDTRGQYFNVYAYGHELPESSPTVLYTVIKAKTPRDGTSCLDIFNGDVSEGQTVRWWECNGTEAQRWTLHADGFVTPYKRDDLCLDPVGGMEGNRDGQPMRLWRCLPDNPAHKFWIGNWDSPQCQS